MTGLPGGLVRKIQEILRNLGEPADIRSALPVGGGCINHATRLETAAEVYFLKWNPSAPQSFFTVESDGLNHLRQTGVVRVPRVIAVSEPGPESPAFILQEWIEPSEMRRGPDFEALGHSLAQMHQAATAETFGLRDDNYIGLTPQRNQPSADWRTFFADQRLKPQMELARRTGRLPPERASRLEAVINHLDRWLDSSASVPSLIHGDLWGGNVIAGPGGEPVLIDPAVSYSDREAEIAFTGLFGGFSNRFYQAYQETWPLSPGYTERRDLLNLYHLLNHLNLFGESYGPAVDSVLRHYA